MATETSIAREPATEAMRVAAVHALLVAVPVLLVGLLLLLPVWLAPIVAVVVAVAVTALRCRGIDARVGSALGARPIDATESPRLAGVVESTSMAVGVASPRLHVIDDPARNAVVWGSGVGPASIAITAGLLDAAERIELEGIVARLLTDVREGVIEAPTVTTALFGAVADGPLAGLVASLARADEDERRVVVADMAAARATQYPPGAVAALERVRAGSTAVARSPRPMQALWYAAPAAPVAGDAFAAHPPLADRIDLLREL